MAQLETIGARGVIKYIYSKMHTYVGASRGMSSLVRTPRGREMLCKRSDWDSAKVGAGVG